MHFATLENESDSLCYKKWLCQLMLLVYPATKRVRTGRCTANCAGWGCGGTWCPSLTEDPSHPPQETLFCTGDGPGRCPGWKGTNLGPGPALGEGLLPARGCTQSREEPAAPGRRQRLGVPARGAAGKVEHIFPVEAALFIMRN